MSYNVVVPKNTLKFFKKIKEKDAPVQRKYLKLSSKKKSSKNVKESISYLPNASNSVTGISNNKLINTTKDDGDNDIDNVNDDSDSVIKEMSLSKISSADYALQAALKSPKKSLALLSTSKRDGSHNKDSKQQTGDTIHQKSMNGKSSK